METFTGPTLPQLLHRQYEDLKVLEEPSADLLDAMPQSGGVVDLQLLFFRFALDIATAFLFGDSVRSPKAKNEAQGLDFSSVFDVA